MKKKIRMYFIHKNIHSLNAITIRMVESGHIKMSPPSNRGRVSW